MTLDKKLSENIWILTQLYHSVCEENYRSEATTLPLSRNQFIILSILSVSGPQTLSEFAKILKISNAATGKNIDKLVQYKLVGRRSKKCDRRISVISITESGKKIVLAYNEIKNFYQTKALSTFSDEEKQNFLSLMRKYIRNSIDPKENLDMICMLCDGSCGEECVIQKCKGLCRSKKQNKIVVM